MLGTIFGANGYKRGDWPQPIHHRVPPRSAQLFPLRTLCLLLLVLALSLLRSPSPALFFFPFFLSLGGRRVAWLEIKHIHHHPYAVSVDKQALNNVMKPAFLFFHVSIMFDGRATARIYASPKQWVSAVE